MQKPIERPPSAPAKPKPGPAAPLALTVNGKPFEHSDDPEMPLLWFLRDTLRLTGTKYACGIGACGACTVLVDGKAARACRLTMKNAAGRRAVERSGFTWGG